MMQTWLENVAFKATRNLREKDFVFDSTVLQRITSFTIYFKEEKQSGRHMPES